MGRKQIKDKKLPSAYPQMSFRLSEDDKKILNASISLVQKTLNKKRLKDEPFINKNDVIIKALTIGLKNIKTLG